MPFSVGGCRLVGNDIKRSSSCVAFGASLRPSMVTKMTILRKLTCDIAFAQPRRPPESPSTATPSRKGKKAHHRKVRTGCLTCRKRRVKCDEAKPSCNTCTRVGHECPGYSRQESLDLAATPPAIPMQRRDEQQAFQFFVTTTIGCFDLQNGPRITEIHVDEFWNPVVLQITESEPAIKHILLAWAELHRRLLYEPIAPNEPFETDFFWQNHCQALRLLGGKKQIDVSVILMACIMFCILENFRGNRDTFLQHLTSGIRILNEYDRSSASVKENIRDNMISRYIRPILTTFHLNLCNIIPFELSQLKEKAADWQVRSRQGGRVLKTWD